MASIILDMSDLVSRDSGLLDVDRMVETLRDLDLRFDQVNPDRDFDVEFTGPVTDIYELINRVADSDGDAEVLCASVVE